MRIAIAISLLALASTSAAAQPYTCRDFVADFMDKGDDSQKRVEFHRVAGFLLGSFYAFTGKPFESEDTSGMAEFEKQVVADCARSPDARVSAIALDLVRQKPRATPPSQSFSPDPQVHLSDARIQYEETIGFARVIYRITNDTDRIIGASVRCSLYDENDQPLGQAGGWSNGIPPRQTVIGEGMSSTQTLPIRSDCRIIRIDRQ